MQGVSDLAAGRIGPRAPLFVIAELGLNHGGDLARALALVDAAGPRGASAVKLQTLRAPPPRRARLPGADARARGVARDVLRAASSSTRRPTRRVAARARGHGLAFLSTPFDEQTRRDACARWACDALKIASGDITHHRLIAAAARRAGR